MVIEAALCDDWKPLVHRLEVEIGHTVEVVSITFKNFRDLIGDRSMDIELLYLGKLYLVVTEVRDRNREEKRELHAIRHRSVAACVFIDAFLINRQAF
jgi:hypothetical protein